MQSVILWRNHSTGAWLVHCSKSGIAAYLRGTQSRHAWPPVYHLLRCEQDLRRDLHRALQTGALASLAEGALPPHPKGGCAKTAQS
ncbi:MAG: hypothetical protein PHX82_13525 [Paracoccaceae bacterium]|nr:hypothetical protein [Paracoccaceae bacterium]